MSRQAEITADGLQKLEEELEYLTTVRRREVSERIKEARDFGDISENAEYDDAKNEQAQLEERIRRSVVVEEPGEKTGEVVFGSVVHIKDQKTGESRKFQIVGSTEADLAEGKLSSESPIGAALLGGKVNQIVSVPAQKGRPRKYKITKIDAA
jgi:transcription elongation factor GreA